MYMQQEEVSTSNVESLVESSRKDMEVMISAVDKSMEDLVKLHTLYMHASEDYKAAIKAVAEQSGLLPAVLRRFVKASAGDKFEKDKQEVAQLALVFDI
jgi:hypothetical protein